MVVAEDRFGEGRQENLSCSGKCRSWIFSQCIYLAKIDSIIIDQCNSTSFSFLGMPVEKRPVVERDTAPLVDFNCLEETSIIAPSITCTPSCEAFLFGIDHHYYATTAMKCLRFFSSACELTVFDVFRNYFVFPRWIFLKHEAPSSYVVGPFGHSWPRQCFSGCRL